MKTKTIQITSTPSVLTNREADTLMMTAWTLDQLRLFYRKLYFWVMDDEEEKEVETTTADGHYLSAAASIAFGMMFPPLLLCAAYHILRAKQAEKKGGKR